MLNDLSVFTEPWRKKRPFGFVGNPQRHADPDAYFLYFLDDGTFGKEEWAGRAGLLAPGRRLGRGGAARVRPRAGRARRPARRRRAARRHGDGAPRLALAAASRWARGRWPRSSCPPGAGVRYYDTYLHVLHLASRRGAPRSPTAASVGAFVDVRLVHGPAVRRPMSERLARVALGVLSGLVLLASAGRRPAEGRRTGRFWSDGATYHAMAGSLAFDGDLEFEAEDLARVRASYPGGPQGVFLKRVGGGLRRRRGSSTRRRSSTRLAAAPFVRAARDGPRPPGPERAAVRRRPVARLRRAAPRRPGAGAAAAGVARDRSRAGSCPSTFSGRRPEIFNLAIATCGPRRLEARVAPRVRAPPRRRRLLEADEPRPGAPAPPGAAASPAARRGRAEARRGGAARRRGRGGGGLRLRR